MHSNGRMNSAALALRRGAGLGLAGVLLSACVLKLQTTPPDVLASSPLDPGRVTVKYSQASLSVDLGAEAIRDRVNQAGAAAILLEWYTDRVPDEHRSLVALINPLEQDAPAGDGDEGEDEGERGDDGAEASEDAASSEQDAPEPEAEARTFNPADPWFGFDVPAPGAPYEAPTWFELEDGKEARVMFWPREHRVTTHDGALVFEVTFDVAAGIARTKSGRGAPVYACGCDGRPWCGRRERDLGTVTARYALHLDVDTSWRLQPEATFEMEHDFTCRSPDPRGRWVDRSEELLKRLEPLRDAVESAWSHDFRRDTSLESAVTEAWRGLFTPVEVPEDTRSLMLRPRELDVTDLRFHEDHLRIGLTATLRPLLKAFGGREPTPLPPRGGRDGASGFRVIAEMILPNRLLDDQFEHMIGRRYPDRPVNSIRIANVGMYGGPGHASVRLGIDGDAVGDAYFIGQLLLDEEHALLYLDDVSPTDDTYDGLALLADDIQYWNMESKTVPWVDLDDLATEITARGRWSLTDASEALAASLERAVSGLRIGDTRLSFANPTFRYLMFSIDEADARILVLVNGDTEAP